jgi:16S rRNA (guanine527-N7)-methyltransferase
VCGASSATLADILAEAQQQGFVGPGPIEPHLVHAAGFAAATGASSAGDDGPATALDLGSGGGLPGLALAQLWPATRWVLLEANGRRAAFLIEAVARLALEDRVVVDHRRAEVAGRDPERRTRSEMVVARSFGPPAVVAECGAPFLTVGGRLLVSEPPERPDRWPADSLAPLGLVPEPIEAAPATGIVCLRQVTPCPDRYPRRDGVPAKRPLF